MTFDHGNWLAVCPWIYLFAYFNLMPSVQVSIDFRCLQLLDFFLYWWLEMWEEEKKNSTKIIKMTKMSWNYSIVPSSSNWRWILEFILLPWNLYSRQLNCFRHFKFHRHSFFLFKLEFTTLYNVTCIHYSLNP